MTKQILLLFLLFIITGCNTNNNNPIYSQENTSELNRLASGSPYTVKIAESNNQIDIGIKNDLQICWFFINLKNKDLININDIIFSDFFDDEIWVMYMDEANFGNYISFVIYLDPSLEIDTTMAIPSEFNDILFSIEFEWKENLSIENPEIVFTDIWVYSDIYATDEYHWNLNYSIYKNNYKK